MSATIGELLQAFGALPANEREEFIREVLRRVPPRDGSVRLGERGINKTRAADLRARLQTFAEDWDRPEASIYD
jgi:hypothetical protein